MLEQKSRVGSITENILPAVLFLYLVTQNLDRFSWRVDISWMIDCANKVFFGITIVVAGLTVINLIDRSKQGTRALVEDLANLLLLVTAAFFVMIGAGQKYVVMAMILYLATRTNFRKSGVAVLSYFILAIVTAGIGTIFDVTGDEVVVFFYGTCHSFGMSHPNQLGMYMFFAIVYAWYLFGNYGKGLKCTIAIALALVMSSVALFFTTGCRTAVLALDLLAVMSFWRGFRSEEKHRFFGGVFMMLPVIMFILSMALGAVLVPMDGQLTDSNFISRFVEGIYAYRQVGWHLTYMELNTPLRTFYFDNGYIYWVFQCGLIATAGVLAVCLKMNHLVLESGSRQKLIIMVLTAAYFCMEKGSIFVVILLIGFSGYWSEEEKPNE